MFERIHNTKERIFFFRKAKSGFLNHSKERNYNPRNITTYYICSPLLTNFSPHNWGKFRMMSKNVT